jgi:hypothetical protein
VALNTAHDTAYKQLECVRLTSPGGHTLRLEQYDCSVPDAGITILPGVSYDPTVVRDADILGTVPPVFQPSGGLATNSGPRMLKLTMVSGRTAYYEIQPAIGTIRECRTVDLTKAPPDCKE